METLLQAHRDRKEGKTTVYTLVEELLGYVKLGKIQALAYVVIDHDLNIKTGWSPNTITALGMLEAGKSAIVDYMKMT